MGSSGFVALTLVASLVALSFPCQSSADPSGSLVRDSASGVVDLSNAQNGGRLLLAHSEGSPAPAPSVFKSQASAPGPAGVRNVTSFAAYGTAVNPSNDITGRVNTNGKNPPKGYMCVVFGSTTSVSCENEERPAPACCSSQGADATCSSWDNGGRVACTTSSTPYPACCEDRNQPRAICTLPASDKSCNNDYPVPGCCDDTLCTVFKSGDSVNCQGSNVARCCPS